MDAGSEVGGSWGWERPPVQCSAHLQGVDHAAPVPIELREDRLHADALVVGVLVGPLLLR